MTTVQTLNKIGKALSAERDQDTLLELILSSARQLTAADAGTLYIVDESQTPPLLRFAQLQNDTLKVATSGVNALHELGFKDIELTDAHQNGQARTRWVVQHAIVSGETVNIADVYQATDFDVSGTKAFDAQSGYRSCSMLVVPMLDHEDHVIGALQLINKIPQDDEPAAQPCAFSPADEDVTQSLASQGAMALTQHRLVDSLHNLFSSFTQVIASAIDSKSSQTGAHCRRVPDVTLMLAKAACRSTLPVAKTFDLNDDELYELELAAWLHDCGKIVTPHHVVEKSTKLETVYDGIELVEARLEILRRDQRIAQLEAELEAAKNASDTAPSSAVKSLDASRAALQQEPSLALNESTLAFLRTLNKGSEFVSDDALHRLERLATLRYETVDGMHKPLLDEQMLKNLSIRRGTLNDDERQIMNDHMVHTLAMLNQLPFPKHLRRIPEYAGGHHEKMNGQGYPLGLTREDMSIPARMMGIADVFEALTAPERSYKAPMPLSQALTIMGRMVEDEHLDGELFELFIDEKVYLEYARMHLAEQQIDRVDVSKLPGYPATCVAGSP